MTRFTRSLIAALAALALPLAGQAQRIPSTWPQNYTGIPPGDYSPDWQAYFQVTDPLPNVTFPFSNGQSFAGNIKVNRQGHDNDTLFFWAVERENGSLTAPADDDCDKPWLIWLNGGPGSSSFLGFLGENGPLHFTNDGGMTKNNLSWDNLADAIWVDQPVGTGFSTADQTGYVADEDQTGHDFLGFLSNLVKVFPSLASRPFHLTGESYAGTYIPYISKAILSTPEPPVNLVKFAIGDGAIADYSVFEELPAVSLIETYPELIGFDTDVLAYFQEQTHLCGYDLNLTYPQNGIFPTLNNPFTFPPEDALGAFLGISDSPVTLASLTAMTAQRHAAQVEAGVVEPHTSLDKRGLERREERRIEWKRDLSGRANGTIDPFYGCFLLDEVVDYAVNFSFPWSIGGGDAWDFYDIPDALNPETLSNLDNGDIAPTLFLNDLRTRTALHAPTSKNWSASFNYPFNNTRSGLIGSNPWGDPSPSPMSFLSELATNASLHNVSIVIYSGNDDALVGHRGTEATIQNTTFGGIQGFTRPPSTPWFDDNGKFAGIVHTERNLTYVLIDGAGHLVPQWQPESAFILLREFILGSNSTGLVTDPDVPAIGGEDASINPGDILPGGDAIFYGSGATMSTFALPSATFASWSAAEASLTAA